MAYLRLKYIEYDIKNWDLKRGLARNSLVIILSESHRLPKK